MAINICCRCLTFLKTVTGSPRPVAFTAKHFAAHSKHGNSVPESISGMKPRHMATKVRTEEEKKSRSISRVEKAAAQEKFPFMPTKSTKQVYVLDDAVAAEIAKVVRKDQIDPSVPVLEANPGPGVLTKALLKAGVKHIVAAEALRGFVPYLEDLQEQFGHDVLTIYNWDYLALWRRLVDNNCAYKEHEDKLAALLPHRDWADGPPLTVVGVIPDLKERTFFIHLLISCARQYGLFMLGRPEWFMAISPNLYKHLLVAKMEENRPGTYYRSLAIVLHLVFDIKLCAELPGWKFTPPFPEKRRQLDDQEPAVTKSMRYLLRLRPHGEQSFPPSEIPAFFSFLNQVMKKKKQRLIPKMEQLVPGCGIHLIMMGFSMMQAIADVSPAQFVNVFKAMQTWPEYEGSPMKQYLAESFLTSTDDENVEDAELRSKTDD